MLRLSDLHEAYASVSQEDAISMANLGAVCWQACKVGLYDQWSSSMNGMDSAKAEMWRSEGRQTILDTVRNKLAEATRVELRLAEAEVLISSMREGVEGEISRRITDALEKQAMTLELQRVAPLQQRVSQLEGKEDMIQLLRVQNSLLTEKLTTNEGLLNELQTSLDNIKETKTRSSHAIGKIGELIVKDMLEEHIIPAFAFSRFEDKTGVDHAADFHLWVMPTQNKTIKILIDAKKYKTSIKMTEIMKLHSDVDADEEASVGIMLSLDSGLCNFKQFEIGKTTKNKIIMYISMENMEDELRINSLIWAIRAVSSVAAVTDIDRQRGLLENIEIFLKEMDNTVKDMDGSIRLCVKTLEMMRATRERAYKRLESYKCGTIENAGTVEIETESICKAIKSDGIQCSNRAQPEKGVCRRHFMT
jgi:hypothetical protein